MCSPTAKHSRVWQSVDGTLCVSARTPVGKPDTDTWINSGLAGGTHHKGLSMSGWWHLSTPSLTWENEKKGELMSWHSRRPCVWLIGAFLANASREEKGSRQLINAGMTDKHRATLQISKRPSLLSGAEIILYPIQMRRSASLSLPCTEKHKREDGSFPFVSFSNTNTHKAALCSKKKKKAGF